MHIMLLPELVLVFFFGELHISFSYCTSASFHKPRGYSCDVCAKEKHCDIIIYKHFSHVDGEASQDFRLASYRGSQLVMLLTCMIMDLTK
jgi:hypothetical protein